MLRKIKKMLYTNPRRLCGLVLCLILLGVGFVYIEALPLRRGAKDGRAVNLMDKADKSNHQLAPRLADMKFVPKNEAGAKQTAIQLQKPHIGEAKLDTNIKVESLENRAQAKVPEMPAGGAPQAQGNDKPVAPEQNVIPRNIEDGAANGRHPQLEKPNPAGNDVRLARVPEHRDNQIAQPDVKKNRVEDDDHHPIKQAVFKDNTPLKVSRNVITTENKVFVNFFSIERVLYTILKTVVF